MNNHNIDLGAHGERIAAAYLRKNGYRILSANVRLPLGQLDIVAKDGNTIVFVEVKTRACQDFGLPEEAINYKKRKKMISLGWCYLKKNNLCGSDCRFDVVSILLNDKKDASVNLIKDAFWEE